jgi:chromosome partitioning protein
MPIVTFLNQKGGVGKTSTCHHLGGALARMGRRVLLVDNDPQSSLSQGLLGSNEARAIDPSTSIAAIYRGDDPYPEQVIRPGVVEGIDLLPGHRLLNTWNCHFTDSEPVERQLALKTFLRPVASSYDWIMIDCPPNLLLCSWSSLVASDGLVVPLQPEDYGAQGVVDVQESLASVKAGFNPSLVLLGYLITMSTRRRTVHKLFEETLRTLYGSSVFETVVPEAADFPEAIMARLPVGDYKPRSAASKTMRDLAVEIESRAQESAILTSKGAA